MKTLWVTVWIVVLAWMAAGCATPLPGQEMAPGASDGRGPETPTATPAQERAIDPALVPPDAQALVDLARADLALKLGDQAETIALLGVAKRDFADASLGVPEPDKLYAQVITPGYVLRFGVGDKVYTYHGSGERVVLAPEP
jgi:hypothetical protein